ncbi:MAG TPA: hypothetical protein VNJ08_01970 [Bacteriovoracaceae bacterium]|nr:hypothetical protein [Bacteriovoracaceae bacterium]
MTPRTIENFSELLIQGRHDVLDPFDLSEDTPILKPLHPKMIKAMLNFTDNPEQEAPVISIPGKYYVCYMSLEEAVKDFPQLPVVKGLPFEVYEHLKSDALFDFSPYGVAVICSTPLNKPGTTGVHQHILPLFLEYALSQELWGAQGKWTRFHERLNTQFDKYKLLNDVSIPGRYALKPEAKKLENRAIKGTFKGNSFVLTFPWTFPLSALIRLEAIIQEEF